MQESTRRQLEGVSVATLATALFKRGLRHQTLENVRPVAGKGRVMVGPAYTLRTIPAREDLNGIEVFRDPAHPQRQAIEQCPAGHVLVIDSRCDPRAASAGSILITRLMVRGGAGIVTDGGFRDSPEIGVLEIAAYHQRPSAPTNLTHHQAIDTEVPIGCGGVAVFPGDIVVGDDEAVIVIPQGIVETIATEAVEMTAFEDFVTEAVQGGRTIIGLYPPTDEQSLADFAAWRERHGR